jgi:1-acyl-sn-glycerol-3-phosphate acyltransferase
MIYPEGTRSRSGNLHKGRTGAARLALRCNAPIIPVGHIGTLDVQPPDQFMMRPRLPVTVRFGAPMWPHDHGDPSDPRLLRVFTDAVMFEIGKLSEQVYVDTYANAPAPEPAKAESGGAATAPSVGGPTTPAPAVSRPPRRGEGSERGPLTPAAGPRISVPARRLAIPAAD